MTQIITGDINDENMCLNALWSQTKRDKIHFLTISDIIYMMFVRTNEYTLQKICFYD